MLKEWSTERLVLRQLGHRDARTVREYGLRSREHFEPWDPLRPADYWERPVVADRLAFELDLARSGAGLVVYLSHRNDPRRVIGRVAISNVVRGAFQSCTVGYGLAPDATGHGYMTEALSRVIRIAFDELQLHRVEANIIPRNSASIAVVRRCGMREEGTALRYLNIAGAWEDHTRFAITSEEVG